MGLTPISPVMADGGTVLIPDFARITKSLALVRSTGNSGFPPLAAGDRIKTAPRASPVKIRFMLMFLVSARICFLRKEPETAVGPGWTTEKRGVVILADLRRHKIQPASFRFERCTARQSIDMGYNPTDRIEKLAAGRLAMGHPTSVSRLPSAGRKDKNKVRKKAEISVKLQFRTSAINASGSSGLRCHCMLE